LAPKRASSPWELGTLAVITAVVALLRFHALAARSFWFDEGVSVAIARLNWYNFVRILWRREANMALYYFLLHYWLLFGSSEFFVRALSVLFAMASIPAMYWLGRRLFDARVGLIATSLLAVNAYHVQYSQDARSYSLMVLLCLLSSLFFLKCLAEPSRRNRAAYIFTSVLAVYAQFFALLLVLAQWLALRLLNHNLVSSRLKTDWRWIAFAISPILVFVATTGTGPLRWVPRPGPKQLWTFALHLTGNGGPLSLAAFTAACIAAMLVIWHQRRLRTFSWDVWRYEFLLLWIFVPLLLTLAVSLVKPLFVPRYFIFCLPALLLLMAYGITRFRSAWLAVPATLIVLILSFGGTSGYYRRDLDIDRDDWRGISQSLLNRTQPGDALMFHVPMGRMPYEFYRSLQPSASAPEVLYPRHGDRVTFLDFVEKPNDSELIRLLPSYRRVWLVLTYASTPSGKPDARAVELTQLLASVFPSVEQYEISSVKILLYSRDNR
jgi:4-amino-4-deoxy-L-arabinose transferase-like glycosyltransferase